MQLDSSAAFTIITTVPKPMPDSPWWKNAATLKPQRDQKEQSTIQRIAVQVLHDQQHRFATMLR